MAASTRVLRKRANGYCCWRKGQRGWHNFRMTNASDRSNRSNILSGLLAGFIAGFIWMAITVAIGGFSTAAVVGGGFGFLVGTAIVAYLIATAVSRNRARN